MSIYVYGEEYLNEDLSEPLSNYSLAFMLNLFWTGIICFHFPFVTYI